MRQIIFAIIQFLLLFSVACDKSNADEKLNEVEAILEDHPDSALVMLNHIVIPKTKSATAHYNLLLTEAKYKNRLVDTCLNNILEASSYYDISGNTQFKVRALYQLGVVYFNRSEYDKSIVAFLKTEKIAKTIDNKKMLGLIYRGIADSFDRLMDWSSALNYYKKSYNVFCQLQYPVYKNFALCDLARAYFATSDYDKAIETATKAIADCEINSCELRSNALRIIGKSYIEKEEYAQVLNIFKKLVKAYPENALPEDYIHLGIAYLENNDVKMAKICQHKVCSLDSTEKGLQYEIARYNMDYKLALNTLESIVYSEESELSKLWHRNYASTISNYYQAQEKANESLVANERKTKVIILLICIFLFSLCCLFYYFKVHLLKKRIEQTLLIAQNLREIITEKDYRVDQLEKQLYEKITAEKTARAEIRTMLSSKFSTLDKLCDAYYTYNGHSNKQAKICAKVEEILDGFSQDKCIITELENTINTYLGDLVKQFRLDCPGLNAWEYDLFIFIVLDFSARAISIFQGVKIEVVYTRKAKLKKKISSSESIAPKYLIYFH
jgi:tetratricopeptide (TPR) repeat protein